MTTVRCVSSELMTRLLSWRNPQGREEGWMHRAQGVNNVWKHLVTLTTTEVGLVALTATSLVETTLYVALRTLSLLVYVYTDRPYKFYAELLQSSSFTVLWGLADLVIFNFLTVNVMTRESFTRCWADQYFNPTPFTFSRLQDRVEIFDWSQQFRPNTIHDPMLVPIVAAGIQTAETIKKGAEFIAQEILPHMTPEDLQLFQDMDPSMYMFVLTKSVFIYIFGAKDAEAIPDFFKDETKAAIEELRKKPRELTFVKDREEMCKILKELNQFDSGVETATSKQMFNELRSVASVELQGSLFTMKCWQKAWDLYSPQPLD